MMKTKHIPDNFMGNLFFVLHIIIFIFTVVLPFVMPVKYLKYLLIFFALLLVHWVLFDGCILTIAENKQRDIEMKKNDPWKNSFAYNLLYRLFGIKASDNLLINMFYGIQTGQIFVIIFRMTRNIVKTILITFIWMSIAITIT